MTVKIEKSLLIVILKEEIKINEYLNSKGITITGKYFTYDKNIDEKDIENQIKLMVETHKILVGCNFNVVNRLNSTIGKNIESFKVQLKRLQKSYDNIIERHPKTEVEKIIISEGKMMLQKGNKSIQYIYNHDYLGIIERSMNREEVCIGRVDQGNLRKHDGIIEIGSIKGMSYDLVEEDLYRYIKRLQKKGIEIDEQELIKIFVYSSHLSKSSIEYLKGLCSYPRDFLKVWERYLDNKKNKSVDEYLAPLRNSINYENNNYII